jgi:hypothetical protein
MSFRARFNFAVFVGPFALLGSLLFGKEIPQGIHSESLKTRVAGLGLALMYLTLGWVCGSIEIHVWRQCNKWRELIAEISGGNPVAFTGRELQFEHKLRLGYMVVYSAMIIAFVCAGILVSQIQR